MKSLMTAIAQLTRFAWVGVCVNLVLYGLYLLLTGISFTPKIAATLVFVSGIPLSFISHSKVTFRVSNTPVTRQMRFAFAYLSAYLFNIVGLHVLVDLMQLPHQIVQAGLIVLIAGGLFLAQRFWIFSDPAGAA